MKIKNLQNILKISEDIFGVVINLSLYLTYRNKNAKNLKQRKMENLIKTLRKRQTNYGYFRIYIEMDGKELSTSTTNTMAIDAAFDDCYDDEDNDGRFYESRLEAQEALVSEILRAKDIEL